MRYTYTLSVRPSLAEELRKAGIVASVEFDGYIDKDTGDWTDVTTCWVTTEALKSAVDTVMAAHNPAAFDAKIASQRTQFAQDVALLKAFQTGTPTQADAVKAIRAQSRILARLFNELQDS